MAFFDIDNMGDDRGHRLRWMKVGKSEWTIEKRLVWRAADGRFAKDLSGRVRSAPLSERIAWEDIKRAGGFRARKWVSVVGYEIVEVRVAVVSSRSGLAEADVPAVAVVPEESPGDSVCFRPCPEWAAGKRIWLLDSNIPTTHKALPPLPSPEDGDVFRLAWEDA